MKRKIHARKHHARSSQVSERMLNTALADHKAQTPFSTSPLFLLLGVVAVGYVVFRIAKALSGACGRGGSEAFLRKLAGLEKRTGENV